MSLLKRVLLLVPALLLAAAAWPAPLVIRAARIEPVSGPALSKAALVIVDGRITALGTDVAVPPGAETLDLKDAVVCPGFIHPFCRLGLSPAGGGDRPVNNAHLRVADELYPFQDCYKEAARAGFTTLCLVPGGLGLRGQGALVRTVAETAEDMLLSDRGPLVIDYPRPSTEQKDLLTGALDQGKDGKGGERGAAVVRACKGQSPTLVHCGSAGAIVNLLEILQPYKDLKLAVYATGDQLDRVGPLLVERKIPVMLPVQIDFERFTRTRVSQPRLLHEAGVKLTCLPPTANLDYFRAAMAEQIRAGLPRDIALRAMTLAPAELLGLDYRLGSLEVGKDANLVILSGDPFAADTTVRQVLIEGRTVYDASWGGIR